MAADGRRYPVMVSLPDTRHRNGIISNIAPISATPRLPMAFLNNHPHPVTALPNFGQGGKCGVSQCHFCPFFPCYMAYISIKLTDQNFGFISAMKHCKVRP